MIPCLYEATEKAFTSNGIGPVSIYQDIEISLMEHLVPPVVHVKQYDHTTFSLREGFLRVRSAHDQADGQWPRRCED